MKKTIALIFAISTLYSFAQIRVVGYLPSYRWEILNQLDYDHFSHIEAAFINPDPEGNILFDKDMDKFIEIAHKNNCLTGASLCGGGDYSWGAKHKIYEKLIATPESRKAFIKKIVAFLKLHNLDGIDNDMEGKALELTNYNIFAQELADAVHHEGLEYTAALGVGGQWGIDLLSKETMVKHDFIMTMSYGGVGNWNWKEKPDEATYERMVKDVNYLIEQGVEKENAIGGVPFYFTEFPSSQQTNYGLFNRVNCEIYSNLFYSNQNPWHSDTLISEDGNPIYINSIDTYIKKLDFAIEKNSGLMIWEVGQDCFVGRSIMKSLGAHMNAKKVKLNVQALSRFITINTSEKEVEINYSEISPSKMFVYKDGEEIAKSSSKSFKIDASKLEKGTYLLKVILDKNKVITKTFSIQ